MKNEQYQTIFPTSSPVDVQDGRKVSAPKSLGRGLFEKATELRDHKLIPLLKVREDADRVYSNGYFENHYSEADKRLKGLLHEKVMAAWGNSLGKGSAAPKKKKDGSVPISLLEEKSSTADRVDSNDYFENDDSQSNFYEKVMAAWANSLGKDSAAPKKKDGSVPISLLEKPVETKKETSKLITLNISFGSGD